MKRIFEGLTQQKFDLIVVGGGIIGTGVARDAAMRGLKTLLLEKSDFAYGTTSRSTRLIHGGLRYLSHFDFKLVRQDLREREVLLRIAPHLVKPLPFLLPITGFSQRYVMAAGMRLYDMLSRGKSLPGYEYLSRAETMVREPDLTLRGLKGSYRFYDCQVDLPERLTLDNAVSASEHGALLLNHADVIGLTRDGRAVTGVRVRDTISSRTYDVGARCVLNVTGHWSNAMIALAAASPDSHIRTTKGIHLVTNKISNNALVLFAERDKRLFFVIPWRGYSLIGTTDTEYSGDKENVAAESADINYLLDEVKRAFPRFSRGDIHYTFAGLRALVSSGKGRVSNVSRSHRMVDHETSEGISGLISILGGKMTGYRAIAQEAVDLICRKMGLEVGCSTDKEPLPGSPGLSQEETGKLAAEHSLPLPTVAHLNALYGSRVNRLIEEIKSDPRGANRICSHSEDVLAQIWYAVKEESCMTVADFMLRRGTCGLASCQGLDGAEVVAVEMGRLLGWNIGEWRRQVEEYRSVIAARSNRD